MHSKKATEQVARPLHQCILMLHTQKNHHAFTNPCQAWHPGRGAPPPERLLHASQPSMHVHVPGLTASSAEASPSQGHCHTASRPTTHALGPISSQQQPDLPIDTTTQLASPHMPALKPTAAQRWSYLPLRDTAAQLAGSLHPQIPSSRTSLVKGSLL